MRRLDKVITLFDYSFRVIADEETQQGAIIILDQATGEAVNSKHYLTLEELNEFLDDLYHHLEESILVWGDDANHMHLNTLLELLVSEVDNIG